ncbi:stage II sporulation protein M [Paremcibacter congregatus]|uniref:stage II sporulation protein M n=1 Tax=Paremcibacter congregatus TaxID=2043170 RepID=UPI0030EF6675|tara:strand:- start:344 stop:1363 length:1020 start_codon:yes stop_codon:yes gene_type:complete
MSAVKHANLKSSTFRLEREHIWKELDGLLVRAEKKGIKSLTSQELLRLPNLYRATLSALSVARSTSLDLSLVTYLESLSTRAYFQIYGVRATVKGALGGFFTQTFPTLVRQAKWHVLISFLCMLMGVVAGYSLTSTNQDWFYSFVGTEDSRNPSASTEHLRSTIYNEETKNKDELSVFSTFLFTHNARVGMLAFALGFALGLPTLYLMFKTGLMLGAFTALFASRGLGVDIWAWLLIHGVTELLAVVLCGAAGLILAHAIIFPGKHTRLENLAIEGRRAGLIVLGGVCMFFIAGLLEGFGRQLITDMNVRFIIAGSSAVLWGLYFIAVNYGREAPGGKS